MLSIEQQQNNIFKKEAIGRFFHTDSEIQTLSIYHLFKLSVTKVFLSSETKYNCSCKFLEVMYQFQFAFSTIYSCYSAFKIHFNIYLFAVSIRLDTFNLSRQFRILQRMDIVELVFDVKFLINAYCRLESQTGQRRETDLMADGWKGWGRREQTHTTLWYLVPNFLHRNLLLSSISSLQLFFANIDKLKSL